MTGIIDENGNRANTWVYDTSSGRATKSERFKDATNAIEVTSLVYNADGTVTVTNPLGLQEKYAFTTLHNVPKLSSITRLAVSGTLSIPAATETFGYDPNGYQNVRTDWNGNTTARVNDAHGQPTSITEASGTAIARTTGFAYDTVCIHKPATITEPTRTTTITYDASCNVHTSTVADTLATAYPSRTSTFTWNGTGEILTAKGPRTDVNQTTTFTYDPAGTGNLATVADALSHTTSFTSYDADGRLKSSTDPNGLVTNQTYDLRGNLLTHAEGSTAAGFETTTLLRDATETVTKITNPDASYLTLSRNFAHRITSITNALGEHTDYTLDSAGNRSAVNVYDATSTLNRSHTYAFDALSRLRTDTDAYSNTSTTGYDNDGNRISFADALGNTTTLTIDALNRVSTETDPANQGSGLHTTITYAADTHNLVSQVVSPRGVTTQYTRNGFGEVTVLSSPDTGLTDYTYDLAGNTATTLDANGNLTTDTYDALNRIKTATYQDATVSNYYYDSATNAIGRLKQIADPTPPGKSANTTYFGYDLHGRTNYKKLNLINQTWTAAWDAVTGKLRTETYPSGMVLAHKYDGAGQEKEVDVNGVYMVHDVKHQPFGAVSGWTWGSGSNATYTIGNDLDGRRTSIPLATDTLTIGYDNAWRVNSLATSAASQTIGYDASSEVNSYTGPYGNGNQTLQYDADKNRTQLTTSSATTTYTINPYTEQLGQRQTGTSGAVTYGRDGYGNATSEGSVAYGFDNRERMVSEQITGGTQSNTYILDGENYRISKSGNAGAYRFSYKPDGTQIGMYDSTNDPIHEMVYLDGNIPIAAAPNGGTGEKPWTALRVYADYQNTPRRITDNNASLIWQWDSDPFGVGAANQNPAGHGDYFFTMRFPGQNWMNETGIFYNTFRNYASNTGRYMESDPLGLKAGINTYAYVGNNAANLIDPNGTSWISKLSDWVQEKAWEHLLSNRLESGVPMSSENAEFASNMLFDTLSGNEVMAACHAAERVFTPSPLNAPEPQIMYEANLRQYFDPDSSEYRAAHRTYETTNIKTFLGGANGNELPYLPQPHRVSTNPIDYTP